mmetsp:Transcript_19234/g.46442  ORF Transcript_19234/g.46442 Transcript_19234/m.46442 type:complete len:200 (+) Transcript_19234:601-1200(+)
MTTRRSYHPSSSRSKHRTSNNSRVAVNVIPGHRRCRVASRRWHHRHPRRRITRSTGSRSRKLFVVNVSPSKVPKRTTAKVVESPSRSTTATYATYGCRIPNGRIIVPTVVFAVSVERRTSNTVMIVACASTRVCTRTTTVRVGSTNRTVRSVKSSCLVPVVPRTRCPVAMLSIGSASGSLLHTIPVVRYVKRRPRRRRG